MCQWQKKWKISFIQLSAKSEVAEKEAKVRDGGGGESFSYS